MRPKIIRMATYGVADPNGISLSQTPAAGGIQELTITGALASGGVATMVGQARNVVLTFAGDESAKKFIVTGTDSRGNYLREALAGTATTATTVQPFTTITSIQINTDSAGAIQAGTGTVVTTNWFPLNYLASDFQVALGFDIGAATGSPSFTVEMTLSNILREQGNLAAKPRYLSEFDRVYPPHTVFSHSTMVTMAADTTGNIEYPIIALRLKSLAIIETGGVSLEVIQGGGY